MGILFFPGHATHLLQPLDLVIFEILKRLVRIVVNLWIPFLRRRRQELKVKDFPYLIKKSFDDSHSEENVKKSFSLYSPDADFNKILKEMGSDKSYDDYAFEFEATAKEEAENGIAEARDNLILELTRVQFDEDVSSSSDGDDTGDDEKEVEGDGSDMAMMGHAEEGDEKECEEGDEKKECDEKEVEGDGSDTMMEHAEDVEGDGSSKDLPRPVTRRYATEPWFVRDPVDSRRAS